MHEDLFPASIRPILITVPSITNGAALRAIRERSGLRVRDVVTSLREQESIAVHEDHIRNIETGARNASPRLAAAISRVLQVPVIAILSQPSDPK